MSHSVAPPATVAVFGATARTGAPLLRRLLDAGYAVRAQARTPDKLADAAREGVTVVRGDFTDYESVAETLAGADAVVNLVGHVKGSPADLLRRGLANVALAMEREGLRRVVSLSGAGVPYPGDEPKVADRAIRWVMRTFFARMLADAVEGANVLRASGLDYTLVRAPRLTDGEARGTVREGYVGQVGTAITRADLAEFLVGVLRDGRYVGDEPVASN